MNKGRLKKLKQAFVEQFGRLPNKTVMNTDGSYTPSEWRQWKKQFLRGGVN